MAESNRTEKATPKKRRDERKKGNSFQSKDVISIAVIILGFLTINKMGGFVARQVSNQFISAMTYAGTHHTLTPSLCLMLFRELGLTFMTTAFPLMLVCMTAGVLMTGVQTRFLVSADLLKFKASRISIIEGMKRIVSLRSIVQLVKSVLKIAVVIWMIFDGVKDLLPLVPDILLVDMDKTLAFMLGRVMAMAFKICLFFVAVAILDFAYQKYDYEKKLMMTKQEIKDEYKMTEGDPFIKGKIKEKQRQMSLNRMIQQVPTADVIVRNPTHFAVALKYMVDEDYAPIVVAKGQDLVAERIIKEAEKHGVPVTENVPLARSLYQHVELNDYIPEEFFRPVAEILAWVFKERKKKGVS